MEQEIAGDQVLRALARSDADAVAAALIGCAFYIDDPDETQAIAAVDLATRTFTLKTAGGDRRSAFGLLARGYVVAGDGRLGGAIDASNTPADRAHDRDLKLLATIGITQPLPQAEAAALAEALRAAEGAARPPLEDRRRLIALLKRHDLARPILALLRRWTDGTAPIDVPGDIAIDIAWGLRHLGQLTDALEATAIALVTPSPLTKPERSVLATQRAAILLDLYETRRDPTLLEQARDAAGLSWGLGRSEECSAVYRRLKAFDEAVEDARHATARTRAEERLRSTDIVFRGPGRRNDR